jgi:hypothetical protein
MKPRTTQITLAVERSNARAVSRALWQGLVN